MGSWWLVPIATRNAGPVDLTDAEMLALIDALDGVRTRASDGVLEAARRKLQPIGEQAQRRVEQGA